SRGSDPRVDVQEQLRPVRGPVGEPQFVAVNAVVDGEQHPGAQGGQVGDGRGRAEEGDIGAADLLDQGRAAGGAVGPPQGVDVVAVVGREVDEAVERGGVGGRHAREGGGGGVVEVE